MYLSSDMGDTHPPGRIAAGQESFDHAPEFKTTPRPKAHTSMAWASEFPSSACAWRADVSERLVHRCSPASEPGRLFGGQSTIVNPDVIHESIKKIGRSDDSQSQVASPVN